MSTQTPTKRGDDLESGGDKATNANEMTETLDDELPTKTMKFLNVFAKIIPWLFAIIGFFILILWIIGFAADEDGTIWGIVLASFVGSLLGSWATYQYGVIQDQIDKFEHENHKYEEQINQLKGTTEKLGKEVGGLQDTVGHLQKDSQTLEDSLHEFDELKDQLANIVGDNQELANMLDDTNQIFSDMKTTMMENTRAQLLSQYYECALRDDDDGMTKKEYKRFFARLSKTEQEKFNSLGSFEELAGDDNKIDVKEMEDIIERAIGDVEEQMKEQLKNA